MALVALDALQLVLDISVDGVIGILLGLLRAVIGVLLVDAPSAVRLAISKRFISFLSSEFGLGLAMRAAPVTSSTNGASSGERTSKSRTLPPILTKRSPTLATERVIKVMRSRTTRRTRSLGKTTIGTNAG